MNETNRFSEQYDTICISHLRWDFVWQRPQHLLSRLSRSGRVLFVEEPISRIGEAAPRLEIVPGQKAPNVTVARLIQPVEQERWIGHGEAGIQETYSRLLGDYLE